MTIQQALITLESAVISFSYLFRQYRKTAGDTVLKILQRYMEDLKKSAKETNNPIDLVHSNFLI